MLQKIREKAQGVFAWVILTVICVPFALWGIQNYLDGGKESYVAKVGNKEFFQRDVTRAYTEYSQRLRALQLDEQTLKQQALEKLIQDEVLLQFVTGQGLAVTDNTVKSFIQGLPYFQVDGKFDKQHYEALLNAQNMSSEQFTAEIRKSLTMEQLQRAIMDSAFATQGDIKAFYRTQNQKRGIAYVTVPLPKSGDSPSDEEIAKYFQEHQDEYMTPEQVAIEYVELSVADLAKDIQVTDAQLEKFYKDQAARYSTAERRKISHILFAVSGDVDDAKALEKAKKAKERLAKEDFAALAKELSDDKLTAKIGGDLGLFDKGSMEPSFETAVMALQLGQISEPVKSAFGYHLVKVTELLPATSKPFAEVKETVKQDMQKAEAESKFYELGDKLAEISYEHSDNLSDAAAATGLKVQKTGLFSKDKGDDGIAKEQAIRNAAFAEDVLQGHNSEPVELGNDRVVILRVGEHKPATVRDLKEVKTEVSAAVAQANAKQQALAQAEAIKKELLAGKPLDALADAKHLEVKKIPALTRNNSEVPWEVNRAVFSAAKPLPNKPTPLVVPLPGGEQVVVSLLSVQEGDVAGVDKKQLELAQVNIAKTIGQANFAAVIEELRSRADIVVHQQKAAPAPEQ